MAAGPILAGWIALTVLMQASLWVAGARGTEVSSAVEEGAGRAESRGVGEQPDDVVRKAIGLQRDSRVFWSALEILGDLGFEPLGLILRASLAAVAFAGIAAMTGRPIGFSRGLAACSAAQGFWVLGLAVRLGLTLFLKRPEIETSAALLLGPGEHQAAEVVVMRQLDAFALMGWLAIAWGGVRRRQVGPVSAFLICGTLWMSESVMRMMAALVVGAGMRLSLLPEV